MSGPKVVRIRTREELEAEARAQLCVVEAAYRQLDRVARRCGPEAGEKAATITSRRAMLEDMIVRQRWNEFAQAASAEREHVERVVAQLEAEAIEARERVETRRRRTRDLARTLIREFERTGREVPADLRRAEQAAITATMAELPNVERQVSQHVASQSGLGESEGSAEAAALASRLRDDAEEDARGRPPVLPKSRSGQEAAVVGRIAQLELAAPEVARGFRERLAALEEETDLARRSLLVDSVLLELSREIAARREWDLARTRADALVSRLAGVSEEGSAEVRRGLEAALAGNEIGALATAAGQAEAHLEEFARRRAATARRRAVLTALATLGYEVREGMETALATGGRVVVQKGAIPDYGVEVVAVADSARLQVRVVGSRSAQRTPARDRDAEQRWCGEVQTLRSSLNASGGEFEVERALAPGEAPVKTVEFGTEASDGHDRAERPSLRQRRRDA